MSTAAAPERRVYERHVYEKDARRPPVGGYLREVWNRRALAYEFSRAQVRADNSQTVLGVLWLVLNPLLIAGVYFLLVNVIRHGKHPPGILAHLVAGIFAYHMFQEALRNGTMAVVNGNRLILNSRFPRMLLPLANVITAVRHFWPMILIYIPVHLLSNRPISWNLLYAIPLFAMLVAMTTGLTLLLSTLQVYFRDVRQLIPYVLRIILFTAPILFLPKDAKQSNLAFVIDTNPIGRFMTAWTQVLYEGRAPDGKSVLIAGIWTVAAVALGVGSFLLREHEFAARL